ncbi:MAG: DUF503 domain-containing protein [Acidobacteria bacterium]|nr:DUF503 domain-containing protein [Acidobacteriota bacterium]
MPSVGVLTLELHFPESRSLKDKRHYVKGLKDRLRRGFNVSVAEVGDQDVLTRGLIAVATISESHAYAARVLEEVERAAADFLGPMLVDATCEWLP